MIVVAHGLPPLWCPGMVCAHYALLFRRIIRCAWYAPVVADTLSAWPRSRDIESIPYLTADVVAWELPGSSSEEVLLFVQERVYNNTLLWYICQCFELLYTRNAAGQVYPKSCVGG